METDTTLYPLFEPVRAADESVRWAARPTLLPWIASGLPFLLVGLGWGALDYFGFIRNMKMTGDQATFMIIFFAFHLFPFWGSILYMFYLVLSHKNAAFAATHRRIIIRRGLFGVDYRSIPFDSLGNMEVATGPLHNLFGTGTIRIDAGRRSNKGRVLYENLQGIPAPYDTFRYLESLTSKSSAAKQSF
jgi:membrane protein YdbS with pleckstrin-like domain